MLGGNRGQTIPFWTFATAAVLTVMLFVLNYAAAVTWNVRAQSAADSAAAGGLSVRANVLNEETTVAYAAAVDEFRIRALNAALLNVIAHNGGCDPSVGGSCEQNYTVLLNAYNTAVTTLKDDHQLLQEADNFLQGGQQQAQLRADALAAGGSCGSAAGAECSFAFTDVTGSSAAKEMVACRNVPWVGAALLGTAAPTFQVVAHGASAVGAALTETFMPAVVNPQTGQPYQPSETAWQGNSLPFPGAAYTVDYGTPQTANLTVVMNWYAAVAARPTSTVAAGSYACQ